MRLRGLLFTSVLFLTGCAAAAPGEAVDERCQLRVWYRPQAALLRTDLQLTASQAERPELVGSWNDWQRPGLRDFDRRVAPDGTHWWTIALPLPPGTYEYGLIVGAYVLTDDINPQSGFAKNPLYSDSSPYEAEVSTFTIPDCTLPQLAVTQAQSAPALDISAATGAISVGWSFTPGSLGADLDSGSLIATLRRGGELLVAPVLAIGAPAADGGRAITTQVGGLSAGKYTLSLDLHDAHGKAAPTRVASVFVEPKAGPAALQPARPLDDVLLYHLMVDRFRGPQGALAAPATPGQRAGGTFAGVRAAVEAGYFTRLGVTTLWLSPLYENPPGVFRGRDGHPYEAYHGYWPAQPRAVEPQLGDAAELTALVAAAHQRGLRLVFDAVPNHVYISHPYYNEHSRAALTAAGADDLDRNSWFNDGPSACVCGDPGCDWGTRIEDCWFDTYLPDLNWRHPDVLRTGVADLNYWLDQFDLDGMRIDAVPMMPRAASRRIVRSVHDSVYRAGLDLLIVGEDYTGPGDGGRSEIRSFLGKSFDGLDSAFDFPLMWAARSAIAGADLNLADLAMELSSSDRAFAGSGAVMAHILDNHDTPRFISVAAGNAGNDPWTDPPPQPTDSAPYQRQLMGLTLLLTLPGLPVLYYGDEIGLAGANDPDARRPLPDVLAGTLPPLQANLLDKTSRLGQLRACLPALRRGTRTTLAATPEWLVTLQQPAAQNSADEPNADRSPALIVLSRQASSSPDGAERRIFLSGVPAGQYRDILSGDLLTVPPDPQAMVGLTLKALTPAVYVLAASACQPKF